MHVVRNIDEVSLRLFGTKGLLCKSREWKIYCSGLALSSEPQILGFHVIVWQTTSKKKRKKKIHKGAWRTCIFILVQPSVSLIFGVVVAFSYSHFSKLKLAKQGKNGPRRNEMLQRKQ